MSARSSATFWSIGAAVVASVLVACLDSDNSAKPEVPPGSTTVAPVAFDAVYVVNGATASLSVIDAERAEIHGTITLSNAFYPHHVYLSPDRSQLLVGVPGIDLSGGHAGHTGHGGGGQTSNTGAEGALLVLDALTGATIASRRFPATNHNGVFTPDGSEIWTAQLGNPGAVVVLDPKTLDIRTSIGVGISPAEVTFGSDGKYLFVANTGSGNISVVEPASKKVVQTITVGNGPVGAWQGQNGVAYVDNETDGTVSAIDVKTLAVVRTYDLRFTPGMVAYGPDGNVWVADPVNEKVVLYDASADRRLGEIPAGPGAQCIVFDARGRAYVTNQNTNTVSVLDIASRTKLKDLTVGNKPNGALFRPR